MRDGGLIQSVTLGSGDAGTVVVTADSIRLRSGGQIGSSTISPSMGRGGDVVLRARESVSISGQSAFFDEIGMVFPPSGVFASTESDVGGPGGSVTVEAPLIEVLERGEIASESFNDSRGGTVTVRAGEQIIVQNAEITTKANFADAGDLSVGSDRQVVLREDGEISTTVFDEGSAGNAGAITVVGELLLLDGSRIQANGVVGQGGDVDVVADELIQSADSVIEALSQLGIDGTVNLEAPDTEVVGSLVVLPSSFLDAAGLLRPPCSERAAGRGRGSFTSTGGGALPPGPDGLLTSRYGDHGDARRAAALGEAMLSADAC